MLLSNGSTADHQATVTEHGLINVLLQHDHEVSMLYESYGTPSAVVVDGQRRIASPLAAGADAIRRLLTDTIGTPPIVQALGGSNGSDQEGPPTTGASATTNIQTVSQASVLELTADGRFQ